MDEPSSPPATNSRSSRAPRACNRCRARKVRCDATIRRDTCTNCTLDKTECIVQKVHRKCNRASSSSAMAPPAQNTASDPAVNPLLLNGTWFQKPMAASEAYGVLGEDTFGESPDELSIWTNSPWSVPDSLSHEDKKLLDDQGCFQLPHSDILAHIMQTFFEFISPNLPILDEKTSCAASRHSFEGIPLVLMQAMITACCPFLPFERIQLLGFQSHCEARRAFYRRAKLLFESCSETNIIPLVQAALLLSGGHSNSMDGKQDSSYWLSVAIRFAKTENMHLHDTHSSRSDSSQKQQSLLHKRLWQCCILRDRLLSLALHRPLQIPPEHYQYNKSLLSPSDFEPQMATKPARITRRSVYLLIRLCELAVHLTPLLNTLYPQTTTGPSPNSAAEVYEALQKCQKGLEEWHAAFSPCNARESGRKSTFLLATMLDIWYHTALLSLNLYCASSLEFNPLLQRQHSANELCRAKSRVRNAIAGIIERFSDIKLAGLTACLQLGMAAYITVPLITTVLEIRFNPAQTKTSTALTTKRKLDILVATYDCLKARFDNVSLLIPAIQNATEIFSRSHLPPSSHSTSSTSSSEEDDVIEKNFRLYTMLFLYVELVLLKGRLPSDMEYTRRLEDLTVQTLQSPGGDNDTAPTHHQPLLSEAGAEKVTVTSESSLLTLSGYAPPDLGLFRDEVEANMHRLDMDTLFATEFPGLDDLDMGLSSFVYSNMG